MYIDYQGWNRNAKEYSLINKNLLSYGKETVLDENGTFLVDNDLINVKISDSKSENFDNNEKKIELNFKAKLNNDTDYLFTLGFEISELLPFISPLLLNQKNDLQIVSGNSYDKYEIWDIFNNESYIRDEDTNVNFPQYSKSIDNKHVIIFLQPSETIEDSIWDEGENRRKLLDYYNPNTKIVHWRSHEISYGDLWDYKDSDYEPENCKLNLHRDIRINENLRIHFFKPWAEEAWPLSTIEKAQYIGEGKFMKSESRAQKVSQLEHESIRELIFLIN